MISHRELRWCRMQSWKNYHLKINNIAFSRILKNRKAKNSGHTIDGENMGSRFKFGDLTRLKTFQPFKKCSLRMFGHCQLQKQISYYSNLKQILRGNYKRSEKYHVDSWIHAVNLKVEKIHSCWRHLACLITIFLLTRKYISSWEHRTLTPLALNHHFC